MVDRTVAYPGPQVPRPERSLSGGHALTGRVETASQTAPSFKRDRFSINLLANLGQLGLSMAVGVWYVPYLVRNLGQAAYGLIPLTAVLTSYMGLITVGLNSPLARYLIIELEREDHEKANQVFNASFWANAALSAD